jgi:hypothetical protein
MENWKIQFTAKATLPANAEKPSYAEMVNFLFGTLEMKCEDIKCMQQSVSGKEIYFRCFKEETMRKIVDEFDDAVFKFESGAVARVQMSQESETLKYVRVWGIPPDAPDGDVARFFAYYGDVKRVIREKYPRELNCPIETGVRGIHIDLRQELPHFMFIRNFRIKVHYEGQKERCFGCGSTEHIRSECPKKTITPASRVATMGNMTNLNSFLGNKSTPARSVPPTIAEPVVQPTQVTPEITFANVASSSHQATKEPQREKSSSDISDIDFVSAPASNSTSPTPRPPTSPTPRPPISPTPRPVTSPSPRPTTSPKMRPPVTRSVTRESRSRTGRTSPAIRDRSRRSSNSSNGSKDRAKKPRSLPIETIAQKVYTETRNYFANLSGDEQIPRNLLQFNETTTERPQTDDMVVDTRSE